MKKICLLIAALVTLNMFASDKDLQYVPIENTSVIKAFPNAKAAVDELFGVGISEFNYGKKSMKSDFCTYVHRSTTIRYCYSFSIDEDQTLNVDITDEQTYSKKDKIWNASEDKSFRKNNLLMRITLTAKIKSFMDDAGASKKNSIKFFKDPAVAALFYQDAPELAGKRWFEIHLKGQNVTWPLVFADVKESKTTNTSYKYKEYYAYAPKSTPGTFDLSTCKIVIVKYTNDDKNLFSDKSVMSEVKGICRDIKYTDDVYYFILTDDADGPIPQELKSVAPEKPKEKTLIDIAEPLKKLKGLLDLGAISNDEYEAAKEKLLKGEE